jgi:hypothetical protein
MEGLLGAKKDMAVARGNEFFFDDLLALLDRS